MAQAAVIKVWKLCACGMSSVINAHVYRIYICIYYIYIVISYKRFIWTLVMWLVMHHGGLSLVPSPSLSDTAFSGRIDWSSFCAFILRFGGRVLRRKTRTCAQHIHGLYNTVDQNMCMHIAHTYTYLLF
jgi:hypothetical protein